MCFIEPQNENHERLGLGPRPQWGVYDAPQTHSQLWWGLASCPSPDYPALALMPLVLKIDELPQYFFATRHLLFLALDYKCYNCCICPQQFSFSVNCQDLYKTCFFCDYNRAYVVKHMLLMFV